MTIRAKCSSCGRTLEASDKWAGKTGKCPQCGAEVTFPFIGKPQSSPSSQQPQRDLNVSIDHRHELAHSFRTGFGLALGWYVALILISVASFLFFVGAIIVVVLVSNAGNQTDQEPLRHDITKVLGESNRNVSRISKFEVNDASLVLTIAFNEYRTMGLARSVMKKNVFDILKTIKESGREYTNIVIEGTYPVTDELGNSTETTVVTTQYSRETVERINSSGFDINNIFDIADAKTLNPIVQGLSR